MNVTLLHFAGGIQLLDGMEITVVLPVILAVICFVGVVGNLLILAILIHDFRKGKTSIVNALVINLTTADLLIILFCIPIRAVTYFKQSWTFGSFVCKTTDWFLHCCLVAKSFTLAAMGQARYNYVLNPPKFLHLHSKRLIGVVLSIWTISSVLPIPHVVFTAMEEEQSNNLCVFEIPFYASNFMSVFSKIYPVVAYMLPMLFTVTCYTKAMLRTKPRRIRTSNPRHQSKRITLMLMCVSCAYALMWLPEWIGWIWARHSYNKSSAPPATFMIYVQVLLFVNSTVNPMILMAMSEDFRDGLASIWGLVKCRRPRRAGENRSPKAEENGAEMGTSVIHSLQDLQTLPIEEHSEASANKTGIILPDVEHFWQHRRNTTAAEETDPIPWEHQENLQSAQ
ncbi:G-protein coupled receptor 151-like [Huso huso]|uniref:G-protein coupled receptor 151-like n=1 Tax=Huso huso TaxID=61971 RepID=A0ABR1A996_HUSHU